MSGTYPRSGAKNQIVQGGRHHAHRLRGSKSRILPTVRIYLHLPYTIIMDISMIIDSITHGSTASTLSNDTAPFPAANPPLSSTLEEFRERFAHQNETFKFNPFEPEHMRPATTKNIPNGIDYDTPIE